MNPPRFSIVTISFNQAQFLRQTLDSVLSQKADDVEYIVVDPGSTDGSREILKEYADRIDHLILEPDKGPADGLNKGFRAARGEIGYFLNSDDFLLPRAVATMRRLWDRNPAAGAVLCGAWIVGKTGKPMREVSPSRVTIGGLLKQTSWIIQQGMSFKMEAFRRVDGFNPANRTCWDYELLCDLAAHGVRFAVSNERIAAFRIYDTNLTGSSAHASGFLQRQIQEHLRIHTKLTGRPPSPFHHWYWRFGDLQKHVLYPARTATRLRELTFPATIERRWIRDAKPE